MSELEVHWPNAAFKLAGVDIKFFLTRKASLNAHNYIANGLSCELDFCKKDSHNCRCDQVQL